MTTKKPKAVSGKIHLKWIRSAICAPVKQKLVVKGLGFTRLNQVIERPDNPRDSRHGGEGSAFSRDPAVAVSFQRSALKRHGLLAES